MPGSERRIRLGIALALFVTVLIVYVRTMAGSASFWDCGEFIACAYTLGIPHPPATPLYVVLGRVFTLLPLVGFSIAQKVNFMSAFFGAAGVVMLYLLIVNLVRERRGDPANWIDRLVVYGSGLVGALFTAWSNTYWSNAVEAEVYSISSFVMGCTTLLALRWSKKCENPNSTRSIYLIIYLLSLGVGFHLGTVLTYPAIAVYMLLFRNKSFKDADVVIFSAGFFLFLFHVNLKFSGPPAALALAFFLLAFLVRTLSGYRFVGVSTGLFVLGITIHLFLLIRSAQNPAIDEANPETLGNLMAVLRREQYPPSNPFVRKASWHFQIVEHFWRYVTEQWQFVSRPEGWFNATRSSIVAVFVGLCGIASMVWTARRSAVLLVGTLLITSAGMIFFLNFSDAEVRERDYFYSPAFYFFGVFIGVGAAALLDWFFGRSAQRGQPESKLDRFGYVAGIAVLLLLATMVGERYAFEHDRTRERVPWGYGYNMLAGLDKDALIFTNGDNDTFPLWYQQEVEGFRTDVRVLNLSLLNTAWYPKQLRDNKPKVALSWSDNDFASLPVRAQQRYLETGEVWQPRDFLIRQIILENFGKKQIYFAVTIPPETLAPYMDRLVLEGIVYRFQRERGTDMRDFEKMAKNIDEVYRFDGILTPDGKHDGTIYRDPNQQTLIQNYAGTHIRLAQWQEELAEAAKSPAERRQHLDAALSRFEKARAIAPDLENLTLLVATVYQENGRFEDAIRMLQEELERHPKRERLRTELARAYLRGGQYDAGFRLLADQARRAPDDEFLHQYRIYTLWELGRQDEALAAVHEWEQVHPGDNRMREFLSAAESGLLNFPSDITTWEKDHPRDTTTAGEWHINVEGESLNR